LFGVGQQQMAQPSTVCRRASEPLAVQQLWLAITAVRAQKQVANEERIVRHVRREHGEGAGSAASTQLHRAVSDGLIIAYRAVAQKGSAVGLEQDAYRMPEEEAVS
jgi:hypothetical protein